MSKEAEILYKKIIHVQQMFKESEDYIIGLIDEALGEVRDSFRMDELDAVMISVDKWFDDNDPRLKNNPATRAAGAREIALRAIEQALMRHDQA